MKTHQSGSVLLGAICWIVLIALVVVFIFATATNNSKFRSECEKVGGKAIFDGRQMACIK